MRQRERTSLMECAQSLRMPWKICNLRARVKWSANDGDNVPESFELLVNGLDDIFRIDAAAIFYLGVCYEQKPQHTGKTFCLVDSCRLHKRETKRFCFVLLRFVSFCLVLFCRVPTLVKKPKLVDIMSILIHNAFIYLSCQTYAHICTYMNRS